MIFIVNFPFCNFHSLQRYFLVRDLDFTVIDQPASFCPADFVVLPGVGTFKEGANFLRESGLDVSIKDHVSSDGHLLGICLGMQLLLSSSDESPGFNGLDIFPGNCTLIPPASDFPVPHMGGNTLTIEKHQDLLSNITLFSRSIIYYYFEH